MATPVATSAAPPASQFVSYSTPASFYPQYQPQPPVAYTQPQFVQAAAPMVVPQAVAAPAPVYTVGPAPQGTYATIPVPSLAASDRFQQLSFTPQYQTVQHYSATSIQHLTEEDFLNIPFNAKLDKLKAGAKPDPKPAKKAVPKKVVEEEGTEEAVPIAGQPQYLYGQPQPQYIQAPQYVQQQPIYYGGAQPQYYQPQPAQ